MARPKTSNPTDGEIAILRVLWQRGARTIAQVRRELSKEGPVSLSSVQTRMRIMLEKGLVLCDDNERPQTFSANVTEQTTKRDVLREFIERMFGGSAKNLVLHALDSEKATPAEVKEIRKRLNELDRGRH